MICRVVATVISAYVGTLNVGRCAWAPRTAGEQSSVQLDYRALAAFSRGEPEFVRDRLGEFPIEPSCSSGPWSGLATLAWALMLVERVRRH